MRRQCKRRRKRGVRNIFVLFVSHLPTYRYVQVPSTTHSVTHPPKVTTNSVSSLHPWVSPRINVNFFFSPLNRHHQHHLFSRIPTPALLLRPLVLILASARSRRRGSRRRWSAELDAHGWIPSGRSLRGGDVKLRRAGCWVVRVLNVSRNGGGCGREGLLLWLERSK